LLPLNHLVEAAHDEIMRGKGVRQISWQIGPLPLVKGDLALIRRVILTLFDNALKSTEFAVRLVPKTG